MRALLCVLTALVTLAQPTRIVKGPQWMEIVLERHDAGAWRAIDSGLVLNRDDLVRFRFRTNFKGYLYVINSGTGGSRSLLFPAEASGLNNSIAPATDYSVPTTEAAFRVSGPPGYDLVYWLVSPVALSGNPVAALMREQGTTSSPKLLPRCDDSIFRARGQCIDSSAGPRNLGKDEALSKMGKRDLVIVQDKQVARVSSPESLTGPAIYEFRLAHR